MGFCECSRTQCVCVSEWRGGPTKNVVYAVIARRKPGDQAGKFDGSVTLARRASCAIRLCITDQSV